MVKQKWTVNIDGETHTVEYKCSVFTGKTTLTVDGDSFTVKGKPFGIGIVRNEMVIIGGTQAMLNVGNGGKAKLVCREGEVLEI